MAFLIFLYSGSLGVIRLGMSELERLVFNGVISAAFFLQHSGMIRKPFRRRLNRFVPSHYQGAAYTLASGLVLLAFVLLWQGSDMILLEVHGLAGHVMGTFFFLSILGMGWGMWALRSIDMFGLDSIIRNLRSKETPWRPFTIRGPYRWVRHPLYLFMIVIFWSSPILTADRLLFNVLWTTWVFVGTILEERDLVGDFGDSYRDYQSRVPMLLPRGVRPAYPGGRAGNGV